MKDTTETAAAEIAFRAAYPKDDEITRIVPVQTDHSLDQLVDWLYDGVNALEAAGIETSSAGMRIMENRFNLAVTNASQLADAYTVLDGMGVPRGAYELGSGKWRALADRDNVQPDIISEKGAYEAALAVAQADGLGPSTPQPTPRPTPPPRPEGVVPLDVACERAFEELGVGSEGLVPSLAVAHLTTRDEWSGKGNYPGENAPTWVVLFRFDEPVRILRPGVGTEPITNAVFAINGREVEEWGGAKLRGPDYVHPYPLDEQMCPTPHPPIPSSPGLAPSSLGRDFDRPLDSAHYARPSSHGSPHHAGLPLWGLDDREGLGMTS